jgi:Zn-dependent protease
MRNNYDESAEQPPYQAPSPPPDARVQRGSLRLFSVAGIDVFVHWSWAVVAMIRIQTLPQTYSILAWNVIEYLSLFALVLLHEFGHVLACRQVGGRANKIVLWPLGGIALVAPPPRPAAFLWCLAAGPLVNFILLGPTIGLAVVSHFAGWADTMPDLHHYLLAVAAMNGGLLVFNLLPIFPLDGGQILQALLWFFIGRARSLLVVTILSFVVGIAGLLAALWFGQWWLSLIALFVLFSSVMGFRSARALLAIMQAPRREGVTCPSCGKAPPMGDFWRCGNCRGRFDVFECGGECPDCGGGQSRLPCTACGRRHPYDDWFPEVVLAEQSGEDRLGDSRFRSS